MSTLRKVVGTVAELGAAGSAVAGCLVFDLETGRLQQVKLGRLAVWDRQRWEARRARRAERRAQRP